MNKKYFKTALRFLRRNKLYTVINSLGLSLALASSFIILLFVINEFSYDHCHKNRKRVYRVLNYYTEFKMTLPDTPYMLGRTLREEFPQVEKAIRTRGVGSFKLKLKDDYINVPDAVATDSEIFDIFTLPLVGSALSQRPLDDFNSLVLSRSQADKFFPGEDPVGKEIEGLINDTVQTFTVHAVFEDIPKNSVFRAQCLVSSWWPVAALNKSHKIENIDVSWIHNYWKTWILLSKGSDTGSLDQQFRAFEKKNIGEDPVFNYSLQRLSDVYLKSDEITNTGIKGNIRNIRLFSTVAFLILLIATLNYIILSIAVSTGRAKEIGIRKTTGASTKQIRNQLLSESVLLAMLVLPVALLLMWLSMPYAEKLFHTKLQLINSNIVVYVSVYLVLTLFIGIASGMYASSYLSRLKVMDVLKDNIHFGKGRALFRSFLIVIQLVIFCSFVSGTLVIRLQYQYALNMDPGYHHENVILLSLGRNFSGYSSLIDRIESYPNVIMAAGTNHGLPRMSFTTFNLPHFQDEEVNVKTEGLAVDYHFLETMGIALQDGRYFSEEFGSDLAHAVILNQTAVSRLGIVDPIGKQLGERTIIGVTKDFNLRSIHSDIPPTYIYVTDRYIRQVAVHYKPGTREAILTVLKAEWENVAPDRPFQYFNVEEMYESQYSSEKNLGTILSIAALFTLLIAAFGLFGLTLFVTKSRTREIGIKKVFGSSEQAIVYSFMRSNIILVVIAEALSIPVTFYFMTQWLNDFSYRTSIGWWIFAVAFLIASAVVLSTVFIHSYKASRINPVEALRYE